MNRLITPAVVNYGLLGTAFALSGLLCWAGISQVIGNSVTTSFQNAFGIPQVATATILVAMSAVIVLRKNATVKVLDMVVPVMAGAYFLVTLFVIIKNITLLPSVIGNIFSQAFGIRQFCRRRTWCNRNERRKARTFLK